MKKLILAFASFAFVSGAYAADGADVNFNAEMWFKYYSNKNTGFSKTTSRNHFTQRTKIGLNATKGEDFGAQATFLVGSLWGQNATTGTYGQSWTAGSEANLYEAWVFWKAMDNFVVKFGRGSVDMADGTVISKNESELTPYAFDGVMGAYYTDFATFNGFAVRAGDKGSPTAIATNDAEANMYGLSVDFKNLPEFFNMVNVHLIQDKAFNTDPGTGSASNVSKTRYGFTLKGDTSGFDYRGTYSTYTGKIKAGATSTDMAASMYDLEAGYTLPDVMNLRIAALYHSDTGNTTGSTKIKKYDPYYYDVHNNAGLMDLVKWGNLTYFKVGASLEPAEMTKVGVDFYDFTLTEKGTVATTDKIGTEFDIYANRSVSSGADFGLRYSMFSPKKGGSTDGGATALGSDEKQTQIFAEAKFSF